jgi:signal transduction histidine kinase
MISTRGRDDPGLTQYLSIIGNVFQAVRELLFNVVKHGNTLHADVSFGKINGQTCLTIRDDGAGFDVESQLADAKLPGGLMNLKHRLNLIGCQLQISSQSGKGTQVSILIPGE